MLRAVLQRQLSVQRFWIWHRANIGGHILLLARKRRPVQLRSPFFAAERFASEPLAEVPFHARHRAE